MKWNFLMGQMPSCCPTKSNFVRSFVSVCNLDMTKTFNNNNNNNRDNFYGAVTRIPIQGRRTIHYCHCSLEYKETIVSLKALGLKIGQLRLGLKSTTTNFYNIFKYQYSTFTSRPSEIFKINSISCKIF